MCEVVELLFFDTFAHDNTEEINLDLVQFPKPVYVTEVRIIPLGARVQADFPGGVRLGATNPSQFQIEFFVNDLGKPGASTFETLGGFEYDQNGCINLECTPDESIRKIPTDGLVLKGWYTTITLAVYGTLTNNITEQIIQPPVNPSLPTQPNTIADAQQICSNPPIEAEWPLQETIPTVPVEYSAQQAVPYHPPYQNEQYAQDFVEYYTDVPKDPRSYHHTPETEWEAKGRTRISDSDRDRSRDLSYQKSGNLERDHGRAEIERREKRYSRSDSRDRDRQPRDYREIDIDIKQEHDWTDHERKEYRPAEHEWPDRERHDRDRCYKHDDNYRRSYNEREERKRPRTPPVQSPKRPHTPIIQEQEVLIKLEILPDEERLDAEENVAKCSPKEVKEAHTPPVEDPQQMDVEEFEPILSDEDIVDDSEHYPDAEYDYSTFTNNDDIIKLFTPGVTKLSKYPKTKSFSIKNNIIDIDEVLKTSIGIADDYFKSSITKFEVHTFNKLNTEIKEEFIHLSEKLITTVGPSNVFCDIAKLYVATKSMNPQNLSTVDKELAEQVCCVVDTVIDWLRIALNYELANIQDQPAYKIRHIKCGVRLADWCCSSVDFIMLLWQNNFNIHKELLTLYDQEFMALSIKLMILKALDSYLQHKFAVEKFLLGNNSNFSRENGYYDTLPTSESNGYQILVEYMRRNPLVRIKFALTSIIKKVNLYEVLHKTHSILIKLRNAAHDISAEEINLITKSLNEILRYCQSGPFTLSQPRRFLPVSSQFEIIRSENYSVLVEYFRMFNLLQCFVLLLTYPSTMNLPLIKTPIFEIVSTLLSNSDGLQYLSENSDTCEVLLKCLLRPDDEIQYNILQECIEIKSHHLGLKIAYKLQALYHIEFLLAKGKAVNFDCDNFDILDQLHGLLCLTFSHIGKICCAETLGLDNNIQCLLQFIDQLLTKEKAESLIMKMKKSTGLAYIIDLLAVSVITVSNIPLLEKHWKVFFHLLSQQDIFEKSVCNKLNELRAYLVPFDSIDSLAYDNIAPFVEVISRYSENFLYNTGALITGLRVLQHLGITRHTPSISENPLCHFIELKYKHVILQLFSLEGATILSKLLQRIYEYYEQPHLHSSIFVSNQGAIILNIIQPTVLLIKQMLAYVIQCRNTNFKDLTMIPVLLHTYNLLNSFPATSMGYNLAQDIQSSIVETLLVYTQPVSDEVSEKDSLTKTLWTKMCGEVIKYVTLAPHTFISGLLIFSELLPLPLPIHTRDDLSKEEISWIINLRKLWSAHLHPHSSIIQDMMNKLCISTQPQLLNLLRRICVQISDLAANSAIMVARGILDTIHDVLVAKEDIKVSTQAARLLNFLACLVTHSTIKCAVLHLMHTKSTVSMKTDERYVSLIPAFAHILKTNDGANSHIQAQECILSILQSFCDVEITLMQVSVNGSDITSEEYLANALPSKEYLLVFMHMMWEHVSTNNSFVTYLPIVRTFLLLTEHDYGFYQLKEYLMKKIDVFCTLLNNLVNNFSINNVECLSTLNTLVEFLRVCVTNEVENEPHILYTARKIKLSLSEMKTLIGWPVRDIRPENHPLITLEGILKKAVEENNTFESFLEAISALLKLLDDNCTEPNKEQWPEIILPPPETLLVQYSCRTIFSSSDACDERLTARYWLDIPTDEGETDLESVACDLIELCRQNLRTDYYLVKEVEKLCRISSSENCDDKEKRLDDENLKMKKPFVTPMRARGFARPTPQRSDLFRSRPPNTSRPPSLHVDDFVALETCGAQPTGPTGYNKISRELLASTRITRSNRGRAFVTSERSVQYRQMPWWGAAGMGRGPYQM